MLASALALVVTGPAQADEEKDRCTAAYVAGQELKAASRLLEAAAELETCIADGCAEFVREDCGRWLDEVERATPTVVPRFVDERGRDVVEVALFVDDRAIATRLDGKPIALDPGAHRFRFERAGHPAVERSFTIASGEKGRTLLVALEPAPAPAPAVPSPPVEPSGGSIHPAAWALGAVSVVGFGMLIGFGVHSLTLEDCSPACSDEQVDDIVLERAIADVGLGVGLGALGAAVLVAVLAWDDGSDSAVLRFTPLGVQLDARF
jgi:hypothetical protein